MHADITKSPLARQLAREALEAAETAAQRWIDFIDLVRGDPDLEDATNLEDEGIERRLAVADHPGCPISDAHDPAWIEWTAMRGSQKGGANLAGQSHEDDEDDEDDEGGGDTSADEGEPDFSRQRLGHGAGCSISDPGGCEHDGREPDDDAERETWSHWMNHPPELHIGKRPGHNDNPPEAA